MVEEIRAQQVNRARPVTGKGFALGVASVVLRLALAQIVCNLLIAATGMGLLNVLFYLYAVMTLALFMRRTVASSAYTLKQETLVLERRLGDSTTSVVEIPLNSIGKLDVSGAVGTNGTLTVSKDLGLKEPYCGMVPIISGEIGEDIANYFVSSEQVPTVCGLGVLVNPDLSVKCAGGFLVQLLPFADENCISVIEKNISEIKSVTELFMSGKSAEEIALDLLEGLEPNILDSNEPVYKCDCSLERTQRILSGLNSKELESMAREQEITEVCCNFCNKIYSFSSKEILDIKNLKKF